MKPAHDDAPRPARRRAYRAALVAYLAAAPASCGHEIAVECPPAPRADAGAAPTSILAEWPLIPIGIETRSVSSFDRAGGNDDGFAGTHSELYAAPNGEHVIVDVVGPGRLDTLWFTSAVSGSSPLGIGRLRISVDDALLTTADADQLFKGGVEGFTASHVFDNQRSTGGFVSWVPIAFEQRLVVTTERRPSFYAAHYELLGADKSYGSWTPSAPRVGWASSFVPPIPDDGDGTEHALDTTLEGPGLVTKLTFLPDASVTPVSRDAARAARLRVWWDDEAMPSGECPLDTFFGSGLGDAPVESIVFSMTPARWENRMPMPFWRRARFQIVGLPGRLFLRVEANPFDASRTGHLRFVWHEERPTLGNDDFEYLTAQGAGRLVGTVLTVEPPDAARDKQWWEGDLRSYADGRRTPGVHGTGHEDDHFGGWSNEFFSGPFTLPMHGEPRADLKDRTGQFNGDVTMYRLWPGIPFLRELRHSVEHGTENGRAVNMSATTFFYAQRDGWLFDSDALAVCDDASRAAHALTVAGETRLGTLESAFEGRGARTPVSLCHHAHTGAASFEMAVDARNRGVLLRRAYDQSKGRQSAWVRVGGRTVGLWRVAEQNAAARWAERDFFIPAAFSSGASRLSIQLEPHALEGGPPPDWDAAEYRTLSVVPPAMP